MDSVSTYLVIFLQTNAFVVGKPTHWGLTTGEWITIVAIVVGPILAVVTQLVWQRIRSRRDLKMWVFGTLMSHRGSPGNFEFVKAVNYIDVVFYKNAKIRSRWEAVLTHLSSDSYKQENFTPSAFEKFRDLLAQLLAEMAEELGYKYDHLHIKEKAWLPSLHGREVEENIQLRRGLIEVIEGRRGVNVIVRPDPAFYQQPVASQTGAASIAQPNESAPTGPSSAAPESAD